MQQLYNFLFLNSKNIKYHKIFSLTIFLFFIYNITYSQTFDLTAGSTTDNTPTSVSETLSGITMTVSTINSGVNNTLFVPSSGFGSNGVVAHGASSTNTEEMIISFSPAVDVSTIRVISTQTHTRTWTFTPTGGANTAVDETGTFATSTDVALGFIGVTEITITSNFTGGLQEQMVFDQLTLGTPCSAPTAQATSAIFGTETSSALTLNSFTAPAGGADGYAVYINDSNSFTAPTDGAEPVADLTWNGSGQQPIYFGTSASPTITVSDLAPGTQYFYQIYAYNDCSGTETYETTGLNANDTTQTAVLTVTGISGVNKTYDGTTSASATGTAALSGVNAGASNVFLSGSPVFTFASDNVGTGITINTTGYTLVGLDASKYTLTQPTLSADILTASLTIIGIAANNKVYDDATAGSATGTATLSGVIGADDVSLGGSPVFTFASANVGTGITVNTTGYIISGTDSGNYALTQPTLSANITAKELTITGLTGDNKIYDDTTAGSATGTASLSGVEAGDDVSLGGSPVFTFASANIGTGITLNTTGYIISGTDSGNYTLTQPTLSGNITAKELTITGLTGDNKIYDDTTAGSATGTASLSGVEAGDDVSLGGSPVFTFASANVGTGITVNTTGYTISGTDSGNYTLTQPTLAADITAKTLTITGLTADDKVYDGTTTGSATGTASLSGVEAGDDVSLGGSPVFTFASADVGTGITVNTTGYTISGTDSGNYTLTQPTLSADITSADITWTGTTNNDWNTASNWNTNSVPTSVANVTIPSGLTNYPTISSSVTANTIDINSGASLIANASVSAQVTYNRNLPTTNWYLVGAPVSGETQQDVIANHTFASGSGGNIGVAAFDNNSPTSPWTYSTLSSTGSIFPGFGVSMKLMAAGDVSITGNLITANYAVPVNIGARNSFNLLGNPFPSYINSATLALDNSVIDNATFWFWDGTQYVTHNNANPIEIAPAQGFFIESNANSIVTYNTSNQSHQSSDTFMRTEPNSNFELFVENAEKKKSTKVFFIDGKTTGYDYGYESKMFGGTEYDFAVFTQLVTENEGDNLAIQTLSKDNTAVIPVGIIAKAGEEITFSIESLNLADGLEVYLEDKNTGEFTNLSETTYKTTLNKDVNGIGDYYIHTQAKSLSTTDNNISNVSIYKSSNSELTITGLTSDANISISSLLGKQVLKTSISSNGVSKINLPTLSVGVYIVSLQSNIGDLTKKIIIE